MNDSRIVDVLDEIENQSEFYFLFNQKLVDVERKVDIDVEQKTIDNILQTLFSGTNVNYLVYDRQIVLTTFNKKLLPDQAKTISGKVTDSGGQPLPGVTVVVKGTTQGTVTNADGEYSLAGIPEGVTLVFSFVGMRAQEVVVGSQTTINVEMAVDAIGIEEIVAVGYGTQKKANVTGSVAVIDKESLSNRQSPTVSQLLQGISPGVNFEISNFEGFQPGASMNVSIRGIGSLNGGNPYFVIDGIPGDINNLNPDDIESISVLKDAAASAIYGARASYGVVIITTKRGAKNEKTSITYSGNIAVAKPQPLPTMLDSYTWTRVQNEAGRNIGGQVFSNDHIDRIIAFQNEDWDKLVQLMPDWPDGANVFGAYPMGNVWDVDQFCHADNDWWDINYGHAINQKHDFSIQGGSDKVSYYFSAGYLDQNGVVTYTTDNFNRVNVMGKIQYNIADWWDFNYETRMAIKNRSKPTMDNQGDYDMMFRSLQGVTYPITPVYDGWGNIIEGNLLSRKDGGQDQLKESEYWNTFSTEIRPLKGWKIHADFAYRARPSIRSIEEKNTVAYRVDNTPFTPAHTIPNSLTRILTDDSYWTTNVLSSYEFNINNIHYFNIMAGMQFEKGKYTSLNGFKKDIMLNDVFSLQTALGDPILSESLSHNATQGYFARFNYNYKERYLLESNVRYDGSYVFKKGDRWGFFPSFSAGWNVHNESFWDNISTKYITTLKFRGSWGQLGNQNTSPYSDLALMPLQTGKLDWLFGYGSNRPMGYTSAPGIVNKNLTWETVTTKNLGANIGLLNNRLQTDIDIFERSTTDMIGPSEPKPGVMGASSPRENNSTLRTRGWEIALRWKDMLNNGISYYVNLNLYDYKSVVTKYYNPTGTLSSFYEGQELGEIWGYTVHDLFRSQEEVDKYVESVDLSHLATVWNPGDVRYEDVNNDGKVNNGKYVIDDHGDLSIIGNSEPHWQYGMEVGLDYKGIDFSMLWKGVAKKDAYFSQWSTLLWGFNQGWWEASLTTDHLDYFRDEPGTKYVGLYEGEANLNLDAFWPKPYLNGTHESKNKNNPNTRYLQDASYLRLQNIQLGYTLPQSISNKLYLQNLRVYFSGENLVTFSKLPKGIDPIAPLGWAPWGGQVGRQGSGRLTYGADRIYSLGISFTL
jgi:TonB-linked SusC/RagA family outer membrane protein